MPSAFLAQGVDPRAFFRPDPARPVSDVLGAATTLASESPMRARGEVRNGSLLDPRNRRPERDGLLCCTIFGPVEDHTCLCGAVRGREHEGEVCARCRVEIVDSSARRERFAQITTPFGVVHPALAPAIGELLGIDAADVLEVARMRAYLGHEGTVVHAVPTQMFGTLIDSEHEEQSGPLALHARLRELGGDRRESFVAAFGAAPEALVLGAVPVLPPGDRPLALGDGGGTSPGPINRAYRRFLRRHTLAVRLHEINQSNPVPIIVWASAVQGAQLAFEDLVATLAGGGFSERVPPEIRFGLRAPEREAFGFGVDASVDPTAILGCLALPSGILFAGAFASALLQSDGSIRTFRAPGRALAADAEGRVVLFVCSQTDAHWLLDLDRGAWLEAPQAGFPLGTYAELLEDAFIVTAAGEAFAAEELYSHVSRYESSPDNRHLWVSDREGLGGIYRTCDGAHQLEPWWASSGLSEPELPVLRPDGTFGPGCARTPEEDREGFAFALADDDRWRVFEGGVVLRGVVPWFVVDAPCTAAGFDRSGTRLAIAGRDEALVLSIAGDRPTVAARVDLGPVRAALAWRVDGLPKQVANELAFRHGTLELLAREPDAALTGIAGLGPRRLGRLRAHLALVGSR